MIIRPITLRPWQVRAALDGRLRRIVRPLRRQLEPWAIAVNSHPGFIEVLGHKDGHARLIRAPYAPGDSLWGRETWHPTLFGDLPFIGYRIDSGGDEYYGNARPITIDQFDIVDSRRRGWRSPVTMPRWASRWTLTVGEVGVIRAKDTTDSEAIEAGIELPGVTHWPGKARDLFARQFDADHGPGSWGRNDWCASAAVETVAANIGDNR